MLRLLVPSSWFLLATIGFTSVFSGNCVSRYIDQENLLLVKSNYEVSSQYEFDCMFKNLVCHVMWLLVH